MQLTPSDRGRVIRGGAWRSPGKYCHTANRWYSRPDSRGYVGLRPVLTKIMPRASDQAASTQAAKPETSSIQAAADKPQPVGTDKAPTGGRTEPPVANASRLSSPQPIVMTKTPLTTEQAQAAQEAWAEHIGFKVTFESSIGMKLRVIPPGTWRMSSPKAEKGQKGPVDVTLSQPFLIGQFF